MTAPINLATVVPSDEFRLTSADGLQISCARWNGSSGPVRGVVQIAHGMGEHIGRYVGVISALTSAGLTVYGNDHRGHGHTAPSAASLGDFGEGGFDLLVEDMVQLTRIAKEENPGLPFILLGHSMGSFAAQQYVESHSQEIDGLALSGSGALDGLAHLVSAAAPGTSVLNAAFEPARTSADWLSRDSAVVDAFLGDPLCFAQLQPAAFRSFLAAAPRLADAASLGGIRSDLPIYLFSGSEDPVGQQLEGVRLLAARYREAGIRDVTCDFYPGGRHEMLNEINRGEVQSRLLAWISGILNKH
ncbi:alpha/beta hydrolase [Burkholderia sp. BCC0397]|uniref:alpha/beta fold hydrolase n=1 Tax=Burkholderia sp. BCC0397 TaxID=486876 RepID=UPI00158AB6DF|nr:alpha/beta hydrolase [Burkholderia sp. BCC0397]